MPKLPRTTTVAPDAEATRPRPSHRNATFVTIATRLHSAETRGVVELICQNHDAKVFFARGLDGLFADLPFGRLVDLAAEIYVPVIPRDGSAEGVVLRRWPKRSELH
jgi:hypothetical protein